MRYQGSKAKFAKPLLEFMLPNRQPEQPYYEPFCGSCSVIQRVTGERHANDNNPYLIAMFVALQNGWIPPAVVTEDEYNHIKRNKDKYPPELVGFVGVGCSFGGAWFAGYARGLAKERVRNYANEFIIALMQDLPLLQTIHFTSLDYRHIGYKPSSFIYCDPPYASTKTYHSGFDNSLFWSWVRQMSRDGHTVFVSEYNAPTDFECVWSYTRNSTMDKKSCNKTYTEKLFKWRFS